MSWAEKHVSSFNEYFEIYLAVSRSCFSMEPFKELTLHFIWKYSSIDQGNTHTQFFDLFTDSVYHYHKIQNTKKNRNYTLFSFRHNGSCKFFVHRNIHGFGEKWKSAFQLSLSNSINCENASNVRWRSGVRNLVQTSPSNVKFHRETLQCRENNRNLRKRLRGHNENWPNFFHTIRIYDYSYNTAIVSRYNKNADPLSSSRKIVSLLLRSLSFFHVNKNPQCVLSQGSHGSDVHGSWLGNLNHSVVSTPSIREYV